MLIPLLTNALVATGPTGAITGTVTDATGADVALLPPGHYQLSSVYDLPFGRKWLKGPGLGERLLAHWQAAGILTAQTGLPFTVNLAASESGSAIAA